MGETDKDDLISIIDDDDFDEIHLGKAGEILPAILEGLN